MWSVLFPPHGRNLLLVRRAFRCLRKQAIPLSGERALIGKKGMLALGGQDEADSQPDPRPVLVRGQPGGPSAAADEGPDRP